MERKWRCRRCNKTMLIKVDLNKPRKIRCRCGYENKVEKERNGRITIN